MKKRYTILAFLLITAGTFAQASAAQAPEKMSYQAVLRDASNTLLNNQEVGMQISILQSTITGTAVYIETQTATTNINGLVSLVIGSGTSSDDFSAIDWSAGPYFIKTATDPAGGTTYTITGTSQLMSVPFAMYAKTSGSATPGPQGEPGVQGVAGTQGIQGATGADGASGETGAQGDIGATGLQGASGASGLTTAVNTIAQIDGNITITTTDISEGDNKYYTEALVSANAAVAANTLKVDTDATSVTAAGALMDSELTDLAGIKAVTISTLQEKPAEGAFADGDKTKLDGIDALIADLEARLTALEPELAAIGDIREGGIVFWVDPADNTHGLVCAFSDYATKVEWGCIGTDVPNVPNVTGYPPAGSGAEIGDGEANTNAILADCPTASAALAARSLGPEWFLPSVNELNEMHIHKTTLEAVDGFAPFSVVHWSSTEFDNNKAWFMFLGDGDQYYSSKDIPTIVRAVRAF
jgi:hypothetical protein